MDPPGVRHQCLMLADSESEKTKWVVALNELHRILKKNKLPGQSDKYFIFMTLTEKLSSWCFPLSIKIKFLWLWGESENFNSRNVCNKELNILLRLSFQ